MSWRYQPKWTPCLQTEQMFERRPTSDMGSGYNQTERGIKTAENDVLYENLLLQEIIPQANSTNVVVDRWFFLWPRFVNLERKLLTGIDRYKACQSRAHFTPF